MRYIEIITESRRGHLYHWLNSEFISPLVNSDTLPASFKHWVPYYDQQLLGRSFSRNPGLTMIYRPLLVFNQQLLANNNKIFSLDGDRAFYSGFYGTKSAPSNTSSRRSFNSYDGSELNEEFVIGDIKNVSKKLLYIVLSHETNNNKLQQLIDWANDKNIKITTLVEPQSTDFKKLHYKNNRKFV